MQSSGIPAKFQTPFGANATSGCIRTIPQTTGDPNAASLSIGFPPNTFSPPGAGGVEPDGRDFNGILYALSAWTQYSNQAGGTASYDATFAGQVSGYPKGAVLASATAGLLWISTADSNSTNPDSSGTNWSAATFPSGTRMLFLQAAAPVGWTQITTYNDYTLRIVSGTGGGVNSAGQAFSTATASGIVAGHSLSQGELPNCTFPYTDNGHYHTLTSDGTRTGTDTQNPGTNFYTSSGDIGNWGNISQNTDTQQTGITISSGGINSAHTHGFTGGFSGWFSGSALNINYVDAIICVKS